jgi:peptidoglycan/LPS O-acetylase OafA/YrhL
MFDVENPVLWVVGLAALVGASLLAWRYFGAEARARRRRDRSHGRVISRRHGPSVKLAARTKKPESD